MASELGWSRLSHNIFRVFVVSQGYKSRVPQVIIWRPFGEFELPHQHGPQPPAILHLCSGETFPLRESSLFLSYDVRMADKVCVVSFLDLNGTRHSVEVAAETLYEAAALAVSEFRRQELIEDDIEPGANNRLEVSVKSPSTCHELSLKQLRIWLDRTGKARERSSLSSGFEAFLMISNSARKERSPSVRLELITEPRERVEL